MFHICWYHVLLYFTVNLLSCGWLEPKKLSKRCIADMKSEYTSYLTIIILVDAVLFYSIVLRSLNIRHILAVSIKLGFSVFLEIVITVIDFLKFALIFF